jgi:hypothetical protein
MLLLTEQLKNNMFDTQFILDSKTGSLARLRFNDSQLLSQLWLLLIR